jgi:hypothetical protein
VPEDLTAKEVLELAIAIDEYDPREIKDDKITLSKAKHIT